MLRGALLVATAVLLLLSGISSLATFGTSTSPPWALSPQSSGPTTAFAPISTIRPAAGAGATGPLSVSAELSSSSVCAFGEPTCPLAKSSVRVQLSVTAPPTANNTTSVQVLFLVEASPWTVGRYACDGGEFPDACVSDDAVPAFIAHAGGIAAALQARHPGLNLSYALASTDGTYDQNDDGDSPAYAVEVGDFSNASAFGAAVNRSAFGDPALAFADYDGTDNLLQTGSIPAFYGALSGQAGNDTGLGAGRVNWTSYVRHVVVWLSASAPVAQNWTEYGCVMGYTDFPPDCSGNITTQGVYPTCEGSFLFTGGPDPSCEGWITSQNGVTADSIGSLTTLGAACANASGASCVVDSVVVNTTSTDPSDPGWVTYSNSSVAKALVRNDTTNAIQSACQLSLFSGGSWDGPVGSRCGSVNGTLRENGTVSDPGVISALENVSLRPPPHGGGPWRGMADGPLVRFDTGPDFALAPSPNLTVTCTAPDGPAPSCPAAVEDRTTTYGSYLGWNWSGNASQNALAPGDAWRASFDVVSTDTTSGQHPIESIGASPTEGNASGAYLELPNGNSPVFEGFPALSVAVETPSSLAAVLSGDRTTEVGVPTDLAVTVAGGYPPYLFHWSFGDGIDETVSSGDVAHVYTTSGIYPVRVNVTDAVGNWFPLRTTALALDPVTLKVSPTGFSGPVPLSFTLSAGVSGGLGPYAVSWMPGFGGAVPGPDLNETVTLPGNYTVVARVTDALGGHASFDVPIDAEAVVPPSALGLALSVVPLTIPHPDCGGPSTQYDFSAVAVNATGPVRIVWAFGDGFETTGAKVSHSYARAGSYVVTAVATGPNGTRASSDLRVDAPVFAGVGCVATAGRVQALGYPLVWGAGIVAALAGVGLVLMFRRRR